MSRYRVPIAWAQESIETTPLGFVITGIADGETVVRKWNPGFAYRTMAQAIRHTSRSFPCVHRVTPVDPSNCKATGSSVWFCSIQKLDHARYARDYVLPPPTGD